MKLLFDTVSYKSSKLVTKTYSTSFSLATKMLAPDIRAHIYNIYGFVRFADEIVDSFHEYDKDLLLNKFKEDLDFAIENKISLNPILNAFQHTYHKYNINRDFVNAFMTSMQLDLHKKEYLTKEEFNAYIYGSADVVGLMCLQVFVKGNTDQFNTLKESAMALGSAFQKVNFLRDLKADFEGLDRTYFPNTDLKNLNEVSKQNIIDNIELDFKKGLEGIKRLPIEAKFGVFMAYRYYCQLLKKLKKTPALQIKNTRIRVSNSKKIELLMRSYIKYQLNLIQ